MWVMELAGGGGASGRTAPDRVDIKPSLAVKEQSVWFVTLPPVTWINNRQMAVVWMNRRQNISIVSICSEPLWNCEDNHVERQNGPGWTDAFESPIFSEDGSFYLVRLPVLDGEAGRFPHVNLVSVTPRRVTPLSHGTYEVTKVLAWDEETHFVYFLAAPEGKPGQRHLYRVPDLNASSAARVRECLTCSDSWAGNTSDHGPCKFSDALFSPGSARFYVHECLGPDPPSVWLVRTFEVALEGGFKAQVRLHLPPGLREYEEMMFPLVLHLVSERWGVDWGAYLASNRNFIVAQVDGRGSGFQGDSLRHKLHHRLGSVEVEDQIAVIKSLRDDLKFIDKDHLAVWGWSYGGFATAMILARDENVFRCGISVAPITTWTHYNSAYSERHMGLPNVTDNYRGYEEADVTKRAGNLKEKLFLLIHGTADDNVHYQQSMMLIQALTAEGVLFRHQTYPDENHSFSGVKDHMFKAMESFFDDCFGPLDFEEWELGTSFFTFKQ
ncbi:hypothetical protein B566_EDAN006346 [Ephemera danica]|nr:hypothetical protein B566_EDAN006346 [Ephemera danica]